MELLDRAANAMERVVGRQRRDLVKGRAYGKRQGMLDVIKSHRRGGLRGSGANQRQRVRKAGELLSTDLATDGGLLVDEQQDRFIRTVIEQSQLLPVVRTRKMNSPTALIERIAFTSKLLSPTVEFVAPAASEKPDLERITLDTFEYGGLVTVTYDTLQQSIEGGRNVRGNLFETTLMEIIAERVAADVENFVLNSDTGSADPDFDEFDGIFVLASNIYSHGGAPVDKDLWKNTLVSLPKKFRQNKGRMLWINGPSTDTEWRDELADRGTGLGDDALTNPGTADRRFGAYGIPQLQVTQVPEDLGAGSDEGKIALFDPRNVNVGFFREVFVDWDKSIETRSIRIMVTVRFGFKYEDPDGAAVGEDFLVA